MLVKEVHGLGTASAEPAVNEHVAIVGDLVKALGHLGQGDEQRTGNALLFRLPRFAHVDEHSRAGRDRVVRLLRRRLGVRRHDREYTDGAFGPSARLVVCRE